jgi:hypothetical protein
LKHQKANRKKVCWLRKLCSLKKNHMFQMEQLICG